MSATHPIVQRVCEIDSVVRFGQVNRIMPTFIEADGPSAALGALCRVEGKVSGRRNTFRAEVVRVDPDRIVLSPLEARSATYVGARVVALDELTDAGVGPAFLGRAVDGLGMPIDNMPTIHGEYRQPLVGSSIPPLERASPVATLKTGIRAVDGLLCLGRGQRIGIFAAGGVGKTTLLTQIMSQAQADIVIVCLVGERGREVAAIWDKELDASTKRKTTLVAATSDQSAAVRVRAVNYALAHAEYWRERGMHVLFLLDSVTRLAMAMRELGLAAGEPPTVRGYTPSVFSAIPKVVERCGALKKGGAITAVLTVLSESDEADDPICEMMKSLLDGHVMLSRALAERSHFPAIDVLRSVSRFAKDVMDVSHQKSAAGVLELLATFETSKTLIETGLYAKGSNEKIDIAIAQHPRIAAFLRQGRSENAPLPATLASLSALASGGA